MFTVEIKINGSLIGHIYGRNEGIAPDGKGDVGDKYSYEYYEVETREVRNGQVIHKREDGIRKLVAAILNDAEPKKVLKKSRVDTLKELHESVISLRRG